MSVTFSSVARLSRDAKVLFLVPPFASLDRPSLAAHLLQGAAAREGVDVKVFYANLSLASLPGALSTYLEIPQLYSENLAYTGLGERTFARPAHGLPRFGIAIPDFFDPTGLPENIRRLERQLDGWLRDVASAIVESPVRVVAATTTFEQTNASLALLRAIKGARGDIVTILGGANCEAEMANGVASLDPDREVLDYIVSGEGEVTFARLLADYLHEDRLPDDRVLPGVPCRDMNGLPLLEFEEYFQQRSELLEPAAEAGEISLAPPVITYETSRGCWWGEKHHCTFCGIDPENTMIFRQKSPDRVLGELEALVRKHGIRKFYMTDNIMPHTYYQDLLPRMAETFDPPLEIFYEQKANISLARLRLLHEAGVRNVEAGVESLSTSLLEKMNKGVSARQNVLLLRDARSIGLSIHWNLLWGLPGDRKEHYEEMLRLIPLLRHLDPPNRMIGLSLTRFSPYFSERERFGISNVRPWSAYSAFFPESTDLESVAYAFRGDWSSAAFDRPELIEELSAAIDAWKLASKPNGDRPVLHLTPIDDRAERFHLEDSRRLPGAEGSQEISRDVATEILSTRPMPEVVGESLDWALSAHLGVAVDSWYVPLVTAPTDLLMELEQTPKE